MASRSANARNASWNPSPGRSPGGSPTTGNPRRKPSWDGRPRAPSPTRPAPRVPPKFVPAPRIRPVPFGRRPPAPLMKKVPNIFRRTPLGAAAMMALPFILDPPFELPPELQPYNRPDIPGEPAFGGYDPGKVHELPAGDSWIIHPGSNGQFWGYGRYNPRFKEDENWESYQPSAASVTAGGGNPGFGYTLGAAQSFGPPVWFQQGNEMQRSTVWWTQVEYFKPEGEAITANNHLMSFEWWERYPLNTPLPVGIPVEVFEPPTEENWPGTPPVKAPPGIMPWSPWLPTPNFPTIPRIRKRRDADPRFNSSTNGDPTRPGPRPDEHINVGPDKRPVSPTVPTGGKEKKLSTVNQGLLAAFRAVQKGFHSLTEWGDAIEAVYEALPKALRKQLEKDGKLNPYQQAQAIYKNFAQVDGNAAVGNLLYNQVEDYVIGKGFKSVQDAADRLGIKGAYKLEQPVLDAIDLLKGWKP